MRPDRLLRSRLHEVFIVTLDDATAFRGLLYAADDRSLVLRDAQLVSGDGPTPVDGEVVLPRARVLYLQRP